MSKNRLRPNTTFGERSNPSQIKNTKEVYIISIASEGKSEEAYFDGLKDHFQNKVIEIDRLEKSVEYDTMSHPNHIIKLLDERKSNWEAHGVESDELWMVIDRDKKNVSEKQLTSILTKCSVEGYNLALSNPTFELWILLHVSDLSEYDNDELLYNKKTGKKRYLQKVLSQKLSGYSKGKIDFDLLKDGVQHAINRSKNLATDNEELKSQLGTSIGILVEKLIVLS